MEKPLELFSTTSSAPSKAGDLMDFYMSSPLNVLLINAQKAFLPQIEANLTQCVNLNWEKTSDLSGSKNVDVTGKPFNLILLVIPNDEELATQVLACASSYQTDVIILGQDTPQNVLRHAFQFGVSDFIPLDAPDVELLNALKQIAVKQSDQAELAPVLAVINGKGGSGASFISSCLAAISAELGNVDVALLDTDLHHGALAHILGVEPNYYLSDALQALDDLDEVALKSAMTSIGPLHLLAAAPFSLLNLNNDIKLENMYDLLTKCRQHHQQVILDYSRGPEYWNIELLRNAEILVVAQQNLIIIREVNALIQQLVNLIGIERSRIHILVNRYDKSNTQIKLNDIKKALGIDSIYVVANDYKLASECVDIGKPITTIAKKQRMYLDLQKLTQELIPSNSNLQKKSSSLWDRLMGN
ncbi:pilus assembly protein CpaE [Shewanella sp. 10N.286.52.C2]|uniref:AAA family ATPase n=2 Tax=unclassified Shewanella TaxID=196818 RepID=UPI000C83FF1A|nr:pilus assembly protein CpaE [Shewanella sp. 4_MG-2023]MDO6678119.1 pilus assembly protein CpaE [Shewanella sp. 4_MG-2023]PMG30351.1 pilus assembly protein CpaE [Shewanella sp. 10N.286.52.C2]